MSTLQLNRLNAHDVQVGDRRVLLHIPTTGLFDLDPVGAAILDFFKEQEHVSADDVRQRFDGQFAPADVVETLQEFRDLDIVTDGSTRPTQHKPLQIKNYPLSTIVLNVNTGCNLSCTHCYKEDLTTPAKGQRMDFDTAVKSIELLLREGASRDRVNIVFFGGEPLSNLPLIRQVVDYTERRGAECGKTIDFSLTTNATLLTEEIVDYLNSHRFGIAVSMDGPKAVHDKHRRTVGGAGTYEVVARRVSMLLERYDSRPVGARVTLTAGTTDVIGIHHHLFDELGFFEVGFAPVTGNALDHFNLNGDELQTVFENMKALGERYVEAALCDRNNGFSNMHQLMTDLHEGTKKILPCGAGVGLLAVDGNGELNLCHRFTGSELPTYGNVDTGIDKPRLGRFLEAAAERDGTVCATCRVRNLCAGGCYHESYSHFSNPLSPTYHYCDIMRDWVDFGVRAYTTIMANNPSFLEHYVTPRRAL